LEKYTFIDLFAGIGGFHLAFHSLGCKCVFASEIDYAARQTYEYNLKKISPEVFEKNLFNDDIRKISPREIPDFDILCAGFPCQPFSQAGYKRGFNDTHKSERGNLFFNIVEIIDIKRPKAFFLENVRGLISHDNGKTFKTIQDILENELGYSFYFKIVNASDYGLPQLRPRVFIIGFRDEGILKGFSFPKVQPLKFNMSDVWGGKCSRDIGFTLRVGGRGSNINDRRNWDAYLVNGEIRKLMPEQGKKMQGFPDNFEFPVPPSQAMKQLGNSVAIDAIRAFGKSIIEHINTIDKGIKKMNETKNKGEWTELYSFLKIINDKKLFLATKNMEIASPDSYFTVTKVTTLNIQKSCFLCNEDKVIVKNNISGEELEVNVKDFLNNNTLKEILSYIKNGSKTFNIPQVDIIQDRLGLSIINGGNSNQKADIVLDIQKDGAMLANQGFGIKSYLGSKPTLLNASGSTNLIYEVIGLDKNKIEEINSIDSHTKLKDRINKIYELGGCLLFHKMENDTMNYNLSLVDSILPELIAKMLLEFFVNRTSNLSENLKQVFQSSDLKNLNGFDLISFQAKIKRFLVSILLGFFSGTKWDGKYVSNGTIVVKEDGEQVAFHLIELSILEDYLFENIKFDTPSTTRHRYGSLIIEKNGKIYFKLNLQLRF